MRATNGGFMKERMNMEIKFETEAKRFCAAIKKIAANENTLGNLELYLSFHFDEWLEKFANTPSWMANEMEEFSKIQ